MKESLYRFKRFKEIDRKRPNCISFLKNQDKIETKKKLEDQLNIFKQKSWIKRVIKPNIY